MADEPLLLGIIPDGNVEEKDDKICGWSTNKIGGTPALSFIGCCTSLVVLTQLVGIETKVLRAQAKDSNFASKETAADESSSRFEVDDWCDDAEDWGDLNEISSGLEEFTGKLNLSEDKKLL